jgi:indole-3-glycerol phosphate synthase
MAKTDKLKEIVSKKQERLALAKQAVLLEQLKEKISSLSPCRAFKEAISKPRQISLIAEIKKASPSCGIIRQDFNHLDIARVYQEAEVQAVSVVTEEDYFQGNISFINEVKAVIELPVLRKDFIFDPYQVYESRANGADAILLIADLLTKDQLIELIATADSLGLDYIVEVHAEKELKKILTLKNVPIIGINNRDLKTLEVDLKTTERLYTLVPKEKIVVVESGIKNRQDLLFLKVLGVNAVLIGQAFMEAENIRAKIEEIMGW